MQRIALISLAYKTRPFHPAPCRPARVSGRSHSEDAIAERSIYPEQDRQPSIFPSRKDNLCVQQRQPLAKAEPCAAPPTPHALHSLPRLPCPPAEDPASLRFGGASGVAYNATSNPEVASLRTWRYLFSMNVTVEIPDSLSGRMKAAWKNLEGAILEGFAVEAYRQGEFSAAEVRLLLGHADRWETEAFLSEHDAWPGTQESEAMADLDTLDDLRAR